MDIKQLYVHDGTLKCVEEDVGKRRLTLLVDMPKDDWSEEYIPKRIVFDDVLNYRVHDGLCHGTITMLDIFIDESEERSKIRLETTFGYREWGASKFEITDEK